MVFFEISPDGDKTHKPPKTMCLRPDKSDKYSSSIIRSQIKDGYMEDVTESLGRPGST